MYFRINIICILFTVQMVQIQTVTCLVEYKRYLSKMYEYILSPMYHQLLFNNLRRKILCRFLFTIKITDQTNFYHSFLFYKCFNGLYGDHFCLLCNIPSIVYLLLLFILDLTSLDHNRQCLPNVGNSQNVAYSQSLFSLLFLIIQLTNFVSEQ